MEASNASPEDNKWEALKKCLGEECIKEFDIVRNDLFEGKTIFEYKHITTHQTIHIDQDGKTYRLVNQPPGSPDLYERITKAEAKELLLGQIPRLRE